MRRMDSITYGSTSAMLPSRHVRQLAVFSIWVPPHVESDNLVRFCLRQGRSEDFSQDDWREHSCSGVGSPCFNEDISFNPARDKSAFVIYSMLHTLILYASCNYITYNYIHKRPSLSCLTGTKHLLCS